METAGLVSLALERLERSAVKVASCVLRREGGSNAIFLSDGKTNLTYSKSIKNGKSSVPNDGYRYEDHANDVAGLIEALELLTPIVIGHSMGGMTAALLAFRIQKPLHCLILADPAFLSPEVQVEVYKSDIAEQHRQLLNKSADEILTEARTKHPHRSLDILQLLARARHQTSMSAFQVLRPPYPEYKELVSTIDIASLLVTCESGVISQAVAEELRNLNPRLHIEKITGVGHGLHYDQPERFAGIVKSFLDSISS